ncbi:hypothetical protein [Salinarimonas chemoclinalis]|uniref:hypothetical protein n=1 Tax=Salinarimonas chemoclinalis TaxID=3241599 RepID=UPI0035575293
MKTPSYRIWTALIVGVSVGGTAFALNGHELPLLVRSAIGGTVALAAAMLGEHLFKPEK